MDSYTILLERDLCLLIHAFQNYKVTKAESFYFRALDEPDAAFSPRHNCWADPLGLAIFKSSYSIGEHSAYSQLVGYEFYLSLDFFY